MRMLIAVLPVLAGCATTITSQHDYDSMLGELRQSDRVYADGDTRIAAVVSAAQFDRRALIDAVLAANRDVEAMRQGWRAAQVPLRINHLYTPFSNRESEVFGLMMVVHALEPELFDFEPLDYNTTRGIDLVVRDKRDILEEHRLGYAELKYYLMPNFNHAFRFLKWIVCWDFGKTAVVDSLFVGAEESDRRSLKTGIDENNHRVYWLDAPRAANKIHVIRLKELLNDRLGLQFIEEGVF